MQAIQTDNPKSRGGFRVGAGRKGSDYETIAVRIDKRLLPFIEAVKAKGIDAPLLVRLQTIIETPAPESLSERLAILYGKEKLSNDKNAALVKEAATALGFSVTDARKFTSAQNDAVVNYHKAKLQ